ncbi:hypothetical protein BGZ76_009225 [Entomortierella beljakovae]|nr:hypothetical protein BGZ76_009225 [Entomortierella beljakovae]
MPKVPDVRDVAVQTEVFGGDQISSMSVPQTPPFTLRLSEEPSGQEIEKYGGDQDSNIIVPQTPPLTLRLSEEPSGQETERYGPDQDSNIIVPQTPPLTLRPSEEPTDINDDQEISDGDEMAQPKQLIIPEINSTTMVQRRHVQEDTSNQYDAIFDGLPLEEADLLELFATIPSQDISQIRQRPDSESIFSHESPMNAYDVSQEQENQDSELLPPDIKSEIDLYERPGVFCPHCHEKLKICIS